METPSAEYRTWQSACEAERAAWKLVRNAWPGSENYDAASWQRWQDALKRSNEALEDYLRSNCNLAGAKTLLEIARRAK